MKKLKDIFKKFKRDKVYKAHLYSDGTEIIETVVKNNLHFKEDNWKHLVSKIEVESNNSFDVSCVGYFSNAKMDFFNGYNVSLYDSGSYYLVDGSLQLGGIVIGNIHNQNKFDFTITVTKNK